MNFPSIDVDSLDNIHIAWVDARDDPGAAEGEIYYSKLDNDGNTLVPDIRLTYYLEGSWIPSLKIDSRNCVHIVWFKQESQGSYSTKLYYTKLNNTGTTLIDDLYLSDGQLVDAVRLLDPCLAIDFLNRLHIVFGDDRDGNLEIYYKGTYAKDLSLNTTNIQFSNDLPKSNENFYINATIHNNGEILTNGTVKFYKNSIEGANLIGSDIVSIPVDGADTIYIQWSAISGVYNISVVIETEIFVTEANITNNTTNRTIIIDDPPTISVINPSFDVTVDTSTTISWVANDPDDDAEIELYYDNDNTGYDGSLIETLDQYPSGIVDNNGASQSYDWNTTALPDDGIWYIYAKIDDGIHNIIYSYSQGKIIIDHPNIPPTVEITSPTGGTVSGSVTIQGTADDPDKGNIESVFVSIDDKYNWKLASGTTSWAYPWVTTNHSNGEHVVYARAKDDVDDYSQIKSVTLIVNNGGNIPPMVNIISPQCGTISGEVTIRGTASDLDGDSTITSIQVKTDDNWESAEGTIDWSYSWDTTTLNDGNYTIYVRAFDGIDYSMIKSVTVYVDNPHKPILTITSEIPKEVSGTITLRGTASDSDGEVTKVEIQIDDGEWKEIEGTKDWSYKLDTTKLSDGEHAIKVRVYDDEGEYYVESFDINVNNSGWILWLILAMAIVLLVVFLIIVGAIKKRKVKSRIESSKTQSTTRIGTQAFICPQCNNVFEALQSKAAIQCPYCGLSGTAK